MKKLIRLACVIVLMSFLSSCDPIFWDAVSNSILYDPYPGYYYNPPVVSQHYYYERPIYRRSPLPPSQFKEPVRHYRSSHRR